MFSLLLRDHISDFIFEAEETKLMVRIEAKEKHMEIELAKIAAERDVEMAQIENDKESKLTSKIE